MPRAYLIGCAVAVILIIALIAFFALRSKKTASAAPTSPANPTSPAPVIPSPTTPAPVAAGAKTYTFYQGKDSAYFDDIGKRVDLANNVPALQALCDATPGCTAFNTAGWLKGKLLPQDKWSTWSSDPKAGMYVRNN